MAHETAKPRLASTGIIANHLWLFGAAHRSMLPKAAPSMGYRFSEAELKAYSLPEAKPVSEYVIHHVKPTYRVPTDPKGRNILKALGNIRHAAKAANKA